MRLTGTVSPNGSDTVDVTFAVGRFLLNIGYCRDRPRDALVRGLQTSKRFRSKSNKEHILNIAYAVRHSSDMTTYTDGQARLR